MEAFKTEEQHVQSRVTVRLMEVSAAQAARFGYLDFTQKDKEVTESGFRLGR